MKLLIFGASGQTGRELVRQALVMRHHVKAFVRNPDKLKINGDQLQVVKGDVTDINSVAEAMNECDAVLSALGAASPMKYDQSVVDGIDNIVKTMESKGVKRLIYMSAINVSESRPNAGPLIRFLSKTLLRSETAGHEARENLIRKSGLDWTFVRPGKLSNGAHTRNYRTGSSIKAKGIAATISRADVADFMLNLLGDPSSARKAPLVMY